MTIQDEKQNGEMKIMEETSNPPEKSIEPTPAPAKPRTFTIEDITHQYEGGSVIITGAKKPPEK